MKLANLPCALCGERNEKIKWVKSGFNVVQCLNCNHYYVNPRLSFTDLEDSYNDNKISPKDYYIENYEDDYKSFKKRLDLISKYFSKGKLLDVGCSVGTFLSVAKDAGWDATGIDINKSAIEVCKSKGLNAYATTLEKCKLTRESFDVIIMNDVIEHVPSPKETLDYAKKFLKSNGVLFIVTVDIGALMAKISGKRWLHMKPDEHIHYFTRKRIISLLEEVSYEVLLIKSIGRIRSLDIIVRKLETYSKVLQKIVRCFLPFWIASRIRFNLNPGDEMVVIAKKLQ